MHAPWSARNGLDPEDCEEVKDVLDGPEPSIDWWIESVGTPALTLEIQENKERRYKYFEALVRCGELNQEIADYYLHGFSLNDVV